MFKYMTLHSFDIKLVNQNILTVTKCTSVCFAQCFYKRTSRLYKFTVWVCHKSEVAVAKELSNNPQLYSAMHASDIQVHIARYNMMSKMCHPPNPLGTLVQRLRDSTSRVHISQQSMWICTIWSQANMGFVRRWGGTLLFRHKYRIVHPLFPTTIVEVLLPAVTRKPCLLQCHIDSLCFVVRIRESNLGQGLHTRIY